MPGYGREMGRTYGGSPFAGVATGSVAAAATLDATAVGVRYVFAGATATGVLATTVTGARYVFDSAGALGVVTTTTSGHAGLPIEVHVDTAVLTFSQILGVLSRDISTEVLVSTLTATSNREVIDT